MNDQAPKTRANKDEDGVSLKMAFHSPDVFVAASYAVSAAVAPVAKRLGFGRK